VVSGGPPLSMRAMSGRWRAVYGQFCETFLARGRGRARGSAIFVSVALHGSIFLLLIATARGALLTGGAVVSSTGDSDVVPVSLAGMPGDGGATSMPERDLEVLLTRLRTDNSDVVVEPARMAAKPKTSLDQLFDELDRAHGVKRGTSGSGGHAKDDKDGKGIGQAGTADASKDRKADPSKMKRDEVKGAAASSGGLWGQIEPCWRKLPNRSPVPVTLEIALSPEGRIATPPKIIRPSAETPSDSRLISEARALEAVTGCVPYHGADLASNRRVFRVEFSKSD
jgi:hypothetical protein